MAAGIFCWVAAPAAASSVGPPGGFRLSASNGYSIRAIVFDGERFGRPDGVLLFVRRKHSAALYSVRKGVQVTETTVTADLGKIGSIDLHFVPTGETKTESSACDQKPIEFDAGFYEGRFDFEGEEGFTEAHRSRARGEIKFLASLICGQGADEGIGGHAPGARLLVRRHWSEGSLGLEATKNSPRRPSRFKAWIEENREGLGIEREISTVAGSSAFDFDIPTRTAALEPRSPFGGNARFVSHGARQGVLRGNLTVDFPGRSNVSLRGSRGSLVRWVQNPSHPFRLP